MLEMLLCTCVHTCSFCEFQGWCGDSGGQDWEEDSQDSDRGKFCVCVYLVFLLVHSFPRIMCVCVYVCVFFGGQGAAYIV